MRECESRKRRETVVEEAGGLTERSVDIISVGA